MPAFFGSLKSMVVYGGDLLFTPSIKDKKFNNVTKTNITLVPYSVAMLRWTIFPKNKINI